MLSSSRTIFAKSFSSSLNTTQRYTQLNCRAFRAGQAKKITENKKASGFSGIIEADNSTFTLKALHASTVAAAVLTPVVFLTSPSCLNTPIDLALGVILPVHSHIALNAVVSDYVPTQFRKFVRYGIIGLTSVMLLGFIRLNLSGVGITESIKGLWRDQRKQKEIDAIQKEIDAKQK